MAGPSAEIKPLQQAIGAFVIPGLGEVRIHDSIVEVLKGYSLASD